MTLKISVISGRGEADTELIEELVRAYPCRVGGGIRDVESALRWLDRFRTRRR